MADAFATLDADLPLTLLPVRLEARYLPRDKPTHLLVRVFPDVIHADAHRPGLSAREADAGCRFWTSIWGQTDSGRDQRSAPLARRPDDAVPRPVARRGNDSRRTSRRSSIRT